MRLLLPALLLALAGCATTPSGGDLGAYPAALVGAYDNAAQFAGAPADFKRPPIPNDAYDWLDAQTVTFRTVSAPALGPNVVYVEWRAAAGDFGRQELWSFRMDSAGVKLDIHTLGAAAAQRAVGADAATFATITPADMNAGDPACALQVSSAGRGAWNAQTDPDKCHVVLAAGPVAIDTRVTVMPTGVLYQTSGRLPDGAYVFRTPGGPPYDLRRRP